MRCVTTLKRLVIEDMATVDGCGGTPNERAAGQLMSDWIAAEARQNGDPERPAKRHRTQSESSFNGKGGVMGMVNALTTPEGPWSMVDTDQFAGTNHGVGNNAHMPVLHLPPAAIEAEQQDAQSGSSTASSGSHGADAYPHPFGWQSQGLVSSSPLMLERLSPFLVSAGAAHYTPSEQDQQPSTASPQHHPYSWGDTPLHNGSMAEEQYGNEDLLGMGDMKPRSPSDVSQELPESHLPEPAMPIRRQASNNGPGKGRTLWEEKHGLISPWNVTDDDTGYPTNPLESPMHRPATTPTGTAGWAGASSTWAREWDYSGRAGAAKAEMDESEDMERTRADSYGNFEGEGESGKRIGADYQAALPELRRRDAEKEADFGAVLVWSAQMMGEHEGQATAGMDETKEEQGQAADETVGKAEVEMVVEGQQQEEGEEEGDNNNTKKQGAGYCSTDMEREMTASFMRASADSASVQTSTEGPLLGVSVEATWTAEEEAAFAEGIKAFRKNFAQISRVYVQSKTVHDVIAYYYRCWKVSEGYRAWKKDRLLGRRIRKVICREETEGTITSYRELYDGTEYFRVAYENGMTEELFRYELDMHFLPPSGDDDGARDSDGASSGTAAMSEVKAAGESSAVGGDSSDDDDIACY